MSSGIPTPESVTEDTAQPGSCRKPSILPPSCMPHHRQEDRRHGNTVTVMGMRTDVAELLPASMKIADMVPDAAGTWLMHCHVNDHITAGMQARYAVSS